MSGDESEDFVDSELVAERPITRDAARPAHLSAANIALVAAGGTVGTGIRYGLTVALPPVHGIPVAILTVNIFGAFLLGMLLETLAERSLEHVLSQRLRLGLGTGVLGGFTTYSTLAVDNVTLALGSPLTALAYGLGTVVAGGLASVLGIAVARRHLRPLITRRGAHS